MYMPFVLLIKCNDLQYVKSERFFFRILSNTHTQIYMIKHIILENNYLVTKHNGQKKTTRNKTHSHFYETEYLELN